MQNIRIADMVVKIDCEPELIHKNFELFHVKEQESQFQWIVKDSEQPCIPELIDWIPFHGFLVGRYQDRVYVSYPNEELYHIRWIIYENNYSKVTYYYTKGSLRDLSKEEREDVSHYLFAFFREAFFLGILYQDGISIHSASLIYRQRGIVFSAPSQTGKSTITNRWNQIYGTMILDGDVTVCRNIKEVNYVYGLPWSGTSDLFLNEKVPLEAVIFLKQGKKNITSDMSRIEAFQELFSRSLTALWDGELMQQRVQLTEKILDYIPQIFYYECLPDNEAVDVIKQIIDTNWS